MITIENSNIVNWGDYPGFVCALVMQTTHDLESVKNEDLILPKGEEQVWLLDKAPKVIDGRIYIQDTKINCMGHYYSTDDGLFPYEFLELHFKPKPVVKIEENQECYA